MYVCNFSVGKSMQRDTVTREGKIERNKGHSESTHTHTRKVGQRNRASVSPPLLNHSIRPQSLRAPNLPTSPHRIITQRSLVPFLHRRPPIFGSHIPTPVIVNEEAQESAAALRSPLEGVVWYSRAYCCSPARPPRSATAVLSLPRLMIEERKAHVRVKLTL